MQKYIFSFERFAGQLTSLGLTANPEKTEAMLIKNTSFEDTLVHIPEVE